ncbi:hypothetical protein [Spiroplasma clarkii]|uniref:Uncharacterized protein n=1 Tax=Spiroplasma clarkii TaxID=2139 RepID=A0A2K8KNN2_9MOLU|nr:hypothetical protein [Spiroplasma clarkii]ATX70606.1 hypothetical protein SCLAR_v1c02760 [Spiroplasma clarkii]
MFKLLKFTGFIVLGMMLAPKKGIEIRVDFVDYIKKYRPQIKKFIAAIDEAWELSQGNESDEVVANVEMKLDRVRTAAEELDGAKTKEIAFKALQKIGQASVTIGKEVAKSKNMQAIAKDLALITVGAIDQADAVYSKVKDVSVSMSDAVVEKSDNSKKSINEEK